MSLFTALSLVVAAAALSLTVFAVAGVLPAVLVSAACSTWLASQELDCEKRSR